MDENPTTRPTAYQAMKALLAVIGDIPPNALNVAPDLPPREGAVLPDTSVVPDVENSGSAQPEDVRSDNSVSAVDSSTP